MAENGAQGMQQRQNAQRKTDKTDASAGKEDKKIGIIEKKKSQGRRIITYDEVMIFREGAEQEQAGSGQRHCAEPRAFLRRKCPLRILERNNIHGSSLSQYSIFYSFYDIYLRRRMANIGCAWCAP